MSFSQKRGNLNKKTLEFSKSLNKKFSFEEYKEKINKEMSLFEFDAINQ